MNHIQLLTADERRHFINTQQIFENWEDEKRILEQNKGSMSYSLTHGDYYLYKEQRINRKNVRKCLGPKSEENDKVLEKFNAMKKMAKERAFSITEAIEKQAGINAGYRLGRVPKLTAQVIRKLHQAGAMESGCFVLGTNAMYAYEALMGVKFEQDIMSTGDLDILVDTRRKLQLIVPDNQESITLQDIVMSADKNFMKNARRPYALTNGKGFDVEFIKEAESPPWKDSKYPLSADDIVPATIHQLSWYINAPKVNAIALDERGYPLRIVTVDPLYFAVYKMFMSKEDERNPIKKIRDALQAQHLVQAMLMSGYTTSIDLSKVHMPHHVIQGAMELENINREGNDLDDFKINF
jgi:hypothetical protein